ncbi:hypothetical protein MF406_04755 [Georgenia sp. TF02-10]|uniref:hypothetical protein n=1 Tax=Georgenia sp. TF02-10 TaxID=2917725 RepID=UPI001FA78D45|nr:hypothetical protein [Georgenia sp. TF02-10]UNX55574.1 hypothetical protein MF406_04755 [Georgenia sp. TF02-10]
MTRTDDSLRTPAARDHLARRARRPRIAALAPALALPILVGPLALPSAAADEVRVTASADTYTTSTRPDHATGSAAKVAVGADGAATKVGYLRFTPVSAGQARLVLEVLSGTAGTLKVHATGSGWDEADLAAGGAPAVGPVLGQTELTGGWQRVTIPLDVDLEPGAQVSFALTRDDGGITRVAARENGAGRAAVLSVVPTGGAAAAAAPAAPAPAAPAAPGADARAAAAGAAQVVQQGTGELPVYVSPSPDRGNSTLEAFETRHDAGWGTALFAYFPGDMRWSQGWANLVARHPEGLPVIASPKGDDPASVRDFLDHLPQAWRDKMTVAYHQEPEEDFTTPAQRAQFRGTVAAMADLVRPYGVRNAVHLQEWTIDPYNKKPWGGEQALAEFFDPADVDFISWSLYPPEGRSMRAGIDRIEAFSEKYAPGVPWGVTAAGSPVDGSAPIGGAARAERAKIVREGAEYVAQVGGESFGWFDFDEYLPGQDNLAAKDPALTAALRHAADVQVATQ